MEIKRTINGEEITIVLTDDEIEKAYRERRHYYNREDILSKIDDMIEKDDDKAKRTMLERLLEDDDAIDTLADTFDDALGDNDNFMETFWITAENCIDEALEDMEDDDEDEEDEDNE